MYSLKGFEINGCVLVPEDLSYDDFWDKFINEQSLDQYEEDLGFVPTWVYIDKAIKANNLN